MAGEDAQLTGLKGTRRAKQWLDMSTRVAQAWTNEDEGLKEMLSFSWPYGNDFSFDLGGKFRGGDLEKRMFLAEVKAYRYEMDLPAHYKAFLAKCYVALTQKPARSDYFLWMSWSPFQAQKWHKHTIADTVKSAVLYERARIFNVSSEQEALSLLDISAVAEVANRIWLITLCDKQEELVISLEHYKQVISLMLPEDRV